MSSVCSVMKVFARLFGPVAKESEDTEACSHEDGNTPGESQPVAFKSRISMVGGVGSAGADNQNLTA